MTKKWTEHLYAMVPRKVDPERLLLSRRIGKNWTLRHASLEQTQRLIIHVAKDPAALVDRLRKDKKTLLTGKLFEVVTGCNENEYDEECLWKFWKFAFSPGELDSPQIATAFLEGILEAWNEVIKSIPE